MNTAVKTVATAATTGALLIGAPAAANAGTWIPQEPRNEQPVGWGDRCAVVVDKNYWWGADIVTEWRWLTNSLTGSTCVEFQVL